MAMRGEVTFRLAGGGQPLVLVPVHVNGSGPYEFILDTGASTTVLTPELAGRLGVVATDVKDAMGAGGKLSIGLGRVRTLAIAAASLDHLQVAVTGELHRIGAAVGTAIDGTLGYNFLKAFRVTIDYRDGIFRLDREEGTVADLSSGEIPFRLAHEAKPHILIPAWVNGTGPYQFALDTGASTTVIAPRLALALEIRGEAAVPMTGGGGAVPASVALVESLAAGGVERRRLGVMVANFLTMLSETVGMTLDGVLGYNYLRSMRVTIDYPRSVLRLE
jgi:predicted aspartyl protease